MVFHSSFQMFDIPTGAVNPLSQLSNLLMGTGHLLIKISYDSTLAYTRGWIA